MNRALETAEQAPTLDVLAKSVGMSPYHFHRVFKAMTRLTPKTYAVGHRAQRVRKQLSRRNTVTEAIYDAGFNSNSRFYAKSAQTLGMTPTDFRNGGKGVTRHLAATIPQCRTAFFPEDAHFSLLIGRRDEILARLRRLDAADAGWHPAF